MLCSFASLNSDSLGAIKAFEERTGKVVLAFSCWDANADSLSEEELSEIKELEQKLGLSIVAVK